MSVLVALVVGRFVEQFYAQRTLLKREVLPVHVANCVAAITSDVFSHTTGLHIPVDAGVASAFLR